MITIENKRKRLYQWDLGQRLVIEGYAAGIEVHCALIENGLPVPPRLDRRSALVVIAYDEDGTLYADIPNILLQKAGELNVYIYPEEDGRAHTAEQRHFTVIPRERPADYVYTETEVKRWEALAQSAEAALDTANAAAEKAALVKDGKSAYAYAVEGGYTGSEADFTHKLALPFLMPEMFGAKGDGTTDDSAAIQAAIDAAGHMGIVYIAAKTYKISSGITFSVGHIQLRCDGQISYDGSGAAITVATSYLNLYVNTIDAPNGRAVELSAVEKSVLSNRISVNRITSSVQGLHLITNGGDSQCISYNTLDIGAIKSSEVCVFAECKASWLIENSYRLGKLSGAATGIKLVGSDSNRFSSGILEDLAEDGCAVYIENGRDNQFSYFRCAENYGATSIKLVGDCRNNNVGLSVIRLEEVDISELDEASHGNKLTGAIRADTYPAGFEARVDGVNGITYDPSFANVSSYVNATTFADYIIKQLGARILTNLHFTTTATNAMTFTLGALYSATGSMARGFPVVIKFGNTSGRIKLIDSLGAVILDNSAGAYANATVSVRWAGYDKDNLCNVWEVAKMGGDTIAVKPDTEVLTNMTYRGVPVYMQYKEYTIPEYTASAPASIEHGLTVGRIIDIKASISGGMYPLPRVAIDSTTGGTDVAGISQIGTTNFTFASAPTTWVGYNLCVFWYYTKTTSWTE